MYEMQGPRLAWQHWHPDCSAYRALPGRPPMPDTRWKYQSPGPSRVPGVAPWEASALAVTAVLPPDLHPAQGLYLGSFKIL